MGHMVADCDCPAFDPHVLGLGQAWKIEIEVK